jgi:secretion/DNA translocation related CpaE-like protein
MPDGRPLIATADDQLLESLLELAATAGIVTQVARDPIAVRARWRSAPVVLLGPDLASSRLLAESRARVSVMLVCRGSPPADVAARAEAAGVEGMFSLPDAEKQLVRRLAACAAPSDPGGSVVGVLGGCGGAGASVLAAALAITAVRQGRSALLVDLDPLGGGVDLLLGIEEGGGLRWPDLAGTPSRLAPAALREALPAAQGVAVLSQARRREPAPSDDAICAVVEAGRDAGGLTVLDVPRYPPIASLAASLADELIMVVPADFRSVSAAVQLAEHLAGCAYDCRLVVRRPGMSTLSAEAVAEVVALPLLGETRAESGLAASLCGGQPLRFRRRGPLALLCEQVLTQLAREGRVAA